MECSICLREWESSTCIPRLLQGCGHTFCEECLSSMYLKRNNFELVCPICGVVYKLASKGEIYKLPKNISLLTLASELETAHALGDTGSFARDWGGPVPSEVGISRPASSDRYIASKNRKSATDLVPQGDKCKKHGLLIHSYIKDGGHFLCNRCIPLILDPMLLAQIKPIPKVYYYLHTQINYAKNYICMKRLEMNKICKFLRDFDIENVSATEDRCKNYLELLRQIVLDSENEMKAKLEKLQSSRKQRLEACKRSISAILGELEVKEQRIAYIEGSEKKELLGFSEQIGEISRSVRKLRAELPYEDIQLQFKYNEEGLDNIRQQIKENTDLYMGPYTHPNGKQIRII